MLNQFLLSSSLRMQHHLGQRYIERTARERPARDTPDNQEIRECRRLIDARRQSKCLPKSRPAIIINPLGRLVSSRLIAPFSSRLSRHTLSDRPKEILQFNPGGTC